MSDLIERRYLGDSVYAEVERGMVKLFTDNGDGARHTIYLEPEVVDELIQFYEDAKEAAQRLRQDAALETPEP